MSSRLIASLQRLPQVQPIETTVDSPAARRSTFAIPAAFRASELQEYSIESEQDVAINTEKGKGYVEPLLIVEGGETAIDWTPGSPHAARLRRRRRDALRHQRERRADQGDAVASTPTSKCPQVRAIPIAAASVVGLYLHLSGDSLPRAAGLGHRRRHGQGNHRRSRCSCC